MALNPTPVLADFINPPATTAPPKLPRDLFNRQVFTSDTCGYFDGDGAQPFTCDAGQACASETSALIWGCCVTNTDQEFVTASCPQVANPYTACVEYVSAARCTGTCLSYNRVCQSTLPYCATAYLTDKRTYSLYFCQSIAGGGPSLNLLAAATTTSGEVTTATPPTSTRSTSSRPTTSTSLAPDSQTTSPLSTPILNQQSGGANKGAIAGGVIGGLVGLALIVGGIIWYLRWSKKKELRGTVPEVSQM